MKIRFICALMALVLIAAPARAEMPRPIAEAALVRLHIVAHSDALADQEHKLQVRDAVRRTARLIVRDARSPDAAYQALSAHIDTLTRAARRIDGSARVSLSPDARFPKRIYGNMIVPAGRYRALRVTLGLGQGRNWWCVIYPDLCATNDELSKALRAGSGLQFYSTIAHWIGRGGDAQ